MSSLRVIFTNHSGTSDNEVSIGFLDPSLSIQNLYDQSAIKPLIQNQISSNWYSLENLSSGVAVSSFSGRLYVAYNSPWMTTNGGEPGQTPADQNFYLRFDKMEMTFSGSASDVADLTSIDFWSIPMSLVTSYKGTQVQKVSGLKGCTAKQIYSALNALTSPPVSGIPGPGGIDGTPLPALVPGAYQQFPPSTAQNPGPVPGTAFARIIGPGSYATITPAGIPVTPYDTLQDYLQFLLTTFGPGTTANSPIPGLGNGIIALIQGSFAGVGPNVPTTGPQSSQTYTLTASIDQGKNITLTGSASNTGSIKMVFKNQDLINPSGIYGANAPCLLNGSSLQPGNDIFGWIAGDLFSGLNIGAVGSSTLYEGNPVGGLVSQDWFSIPPSNFYSNLQPNHPFYNQWAATLAPFSDGYSFPYSDRFSPVLAHLNPAVVDTLEIILEPDTEL